MGKRGPKPGTGGRPRKALADNLADGNPGKRKLQVLDSSIAQFDDETFTPPDFLNDTGKEIYSETVKWLKGTDCLGFINPQEIAEYALCKARWLECEKANERSLLAKHPTTGMPIQSPIVDIGLKYLKQADAVWARIWEIVKANSTKDFKKNNPNDMMAALFLAKEG